MDDVQKWIDDFNNKITLLIEQVQNDKGLKELIAKIKHDTFWQNTHGWEPLQLTTISRKKRFAKSGGGLAGAPEDPNIRTGDLVRAFSNAVNIEIDKDFKISYKLDKVQEAKVAATKEYNRDPEEITDTEYEEIVTYVTNALVDKIKVLYG